MDDQHQEEEGTEKAVEKCGGHSSCLTLYRKPLGVNAACLLFLFVYSIFGGFIFLHFEEPNWRMAKRVELAERIRCVEESLVEKSRNKREEEGGEISIGQRRSLLAGQIVADCVLDQGRDERMEWNLKNAVLFGFGILTTLGYGKIEPQTTGGRLFTVLYGFVGVPFTVIIFTNFGRYLQKLERFVRKRVWQRWHQKWSAKCKNGRRKASSETLTRKRSCILPPITVEMEDGFQIDDDELATIDGVEVAGEMGTNSEEEEDEEAEQEQISPLTLICIVFLYLLLGAALIDWLDENVDFLNGIYFAFLCLTAIEYGKLIPTDALYLPLVIAYICFGLAISTIALDIGSTYVKKLYYLGQKMRNIASIKIWFGAKHLRVRELLAALGHNIGLEPTVLCDLDLEQLISNAIQVKEGRLQRVPQTHMVMDGIWPPELVPLFLKDGQFPDWVDAEERRKWSTASLLMSARKKSSFRSSGRSGILSIQRKKVSDGSVTSKQSATFLTLAANQPPERSPPLPPLLPEKLSVRFEEFVHSSNEFNKWPPLLEETSTSGVASDLSMFDQQQQLLPTSSRWSLFVPAPIDADESKVLPSSHYSNQLMMRRSETVPPVGHSDSSLLHFCTFPSLEIHGPKAPLPPLTPLPDEHEDGEEEKEEDNDEAKKEANMVK